MVAMVAAPWTIWPWEPSVLIGLAVMQGLYVLGLVRLRPRTLWDRYVVDRREVIYFTSGVVLLFIALQSPLDELSDHYLFSAHMVQHLILMLLVPPLLLKGMPDWI